MQQQPISAEMADQACSNISRRRGLGKTTWPDRRHPRMLWIKATSPTPTSPAPAVNSTHRSGDVDKWRVFRWSRRRHGTTKGECHLSPNAGMSKGPCLLKADQSQQRSFIHLYISRIQINCVNPNKALPSWFLYIYGSGMFMHITVYETLSGLQAPKCCFKVSPSCKKMLWIILKLFVIPNELPTQGHIPPVILGT